MAIGGASKSETPLAEWTLPIRGVIRGVHDLAVPKDALLDCLNVEILDGTLRGRRGLTALVSTTFGARPMYALNMWQNTTAAFVVMATTAKIWTYDITGAAWTDRAGGLTGSADDPTRICQFAFGTPTVTRAYIANGKDALRTWKPGDVTASTVKLLGSEKAVNGTFISSAGWTLGAGWSFDSTNEEMDHTAGNTADLEQNVSAANGKTYRVSYTIRNRTAGTVTPVVGGVSGTAVSANGSYTEDIAATGTGNLKFTPASAFDGSIDDISVKEVSVNAPIFRDITVLGDSLIGLVGSHDIRWFEPLGDTESPESNTRVLADTPSPTVAIRILGNLGAIAYKKDGAWLGEVTGLPGASAFRFTRILSAEGPANPAALVEAGEGGPHVWMTDTGRVAMFQGSNLKWIAEGTWSVVKGEIDQTKPNRIWGVYKPNEKQVWFTYQRTGQSDVDGLLIVQLERKDTGIPAGAYLGRWYKTVTAGCTIYDRTLNADLAFTANSGAEKSYKITGATDDGSAISSHIQLGYQAVPMLESMRILSIEPFLERLAGYGTLTLKAITNNVFDSTLGTQSGGKTVDLTVTPVKEVVGVDARGRFLAARLEWTGTATVRYRGLTIRVPPEAMRNIQGA